MEGDLRHPVGRHACTRLSQIVNECRDKAHCSFGGRCSRFVDDARAYYWNSSDHALEMLSDGQLQSGVAVNALKELNAESVLASSRYVG